MRTIQGALGLAAVVGFAVAALGATRDRMGKPLDFVPVSSVSSDTAPAARGDADSLRSVVVENDPFRPSRRPPELEFGSLPATGGAGDGPAPHPRPTLVLTGLVWGSAPTAIIEGLPETHEPTIVAVGDTVAGLVIREITRDQVTIVGAYTTWALTVSEAWR